MAPRVQVPANFGKEYINSEVHGNLVLKLKDGKQTRTNSMIMSLNSPVIDNLTTNLSQSTLDMDDFTNQAVDCFVEAMYTGEVDKLERDIFEDVNKMAHVFDVDWLGKRCLKFFKSVILDFDGSSYEEFLFVCEIASRAHTNLKQTEYVECFVKSVSSRNIGKTIFLQRYMADFAQLSTRQMDMALAVADKDLNIVVNIVTSHVVNNLHCNELDDNSLYLLQALDVECFLKTFPSHFTELTDFIIDIMKVISPKSPAVKEVVLKLQKGLDKMLDEMSDNTKSETNGSTSNLSGNMSEDLDDQIVLEREKKGAGSSVATDKSSSKHAQRNLPPEKLSDLANLFASSSENENQIDDKMDTTAGGSATTAGGSATTVGGSATTAGGSATTAGGSATTAGGSAATATNPNAVFVFSNSRPVYAKPRYRKRRTYTSDQTATEHKN